MYSPPALPSLSVIRLKSGGLTRNVSIASILWQQKLSRILLILFVWGCELSAWKKTARRCRPSWAPMLAVLRLLSCSCVQWLKLGGILRLGIPVILVTATTKTKRRREAAWGKGALVEAWGKTLCRTVSSLWPLDKACILGQNERQEESSLKVNDFWVIEIGVKIMVFVGTLRWPGVGLWKFGFLRRAIRHSQGYRVPSAENVEFV